MIFILSSSCNEKINYSGKILNEENFYFSELKNKKEVISKLGNPNFIDPIEKKYYYFSERKNIKNFFKQKITNRSMIVFVFDINESIKSVSEYNLNDEQDVKYIKEKTPNKLIKRGLIKKIFGSVGGATPNITE